MVLSWCVGLVQIFTKFSESSEAISGPIAIVAVGAEVARSDISGLFQFAAIVNINLAVVNTLPLPVGPLDTPSGTYKSRCLL